MYKRQKWRHPSRAQKRNHRCMPVPGSAKKKSVISYLSTERVFRTVGHRKDLSLFLTSQRMPSRYGRVQTHIQSNKSSLRKMLIGDIFDSIFYCNNVVGEDTYFMYTKMGCGM